jgi:hypothetical protein
MTEVLKKNDIITDSATGIQYKCFCCDEEYAVLAKIKMNPDKSKFVDMQDTFVLAQGKASLLNGTVESE